MNNRRLIINKILFSVIILFLTVTTVDGQDVVEDIYQKIEQIKLDISSLKDEISVKKKLVEALRDSLKEIEIQRSDSAWIKVFKTSAYREPNVQFGILGTIYKGAAINVIDTTEKFYQINFMNGPYGYWGDKSQGYILIATDLLSKREIENLSYKEIKTRNGESWNQRYSGLSKKTKRALRDGDVFIGMKRKWVIESWGYPDRINKTTMGGNVSEQFIYESKFGDNKYLYIENGILKTIQN